MKKSYLLLVLIVACAVNANATIRTLCNYPFSPGQFTTFLAAHTAANNNDTIYVHGSAVNYGAINISKTGIVVIGTGHNPVKQGPLVSAFTTISIFATSCQLIGLTFDNMGGSSNFTTGYVPADVNGDNIVDLTDVVITYNNSSNFVSLVRP